MRKFFKFLVNFLIFILVIFLVLGGIYYFIGNTTSVEDSPAHTTEGSSATNEIDNKNEEVGNELPMPPALPD